MHKRLIALFTVLLLLVPGGCDLSLVSPAPAEESPARDPYQYLSSFRDAWQYATLSAEEQTYYGHLYTAVKESEDQNALVTVTDATGAPRTFAGVRVSLPGAALSKERMSALFEAFFRDNPQFFYLSRTYHLEGRSAAGDTTVYDALILEFTLSLEQRRTAAEALEQAVSAIVDSCPVNTDDYLRELYLHDRLAEGCVYDRETAQQTTDAESTAYTAYGALVEGKAVCEGYAKAMQLLLHRCGMEATVVSGHSKKTGEAHMWNLVKSNGDTYHLDPTWNDSGTFLQHTYFNLTTAMITASHTLDGEQPAVTACTATQDNFFMRNGAYIDTYERQSIAEAIVQQLVNRRSVIQLKFADGKLANGQLFLKNRTLVCQKVNPYLEELGLSLWEYQLWVDEEQQVLTLVEKSE